MRWLKWKIFIPGILLSLLVLVLIHNVPVNLSMEDKQVIREFLEASDLKTTHFLQHQNPDDELIWIRKVQQEFQKVNACNTPIPERHLREPLQVFASKCGACYDKSRTLEKIFKYLGYPTRHVYLFHAENGTKTRFLNLFQRNLASHASLEIKCQKGWLLMDPLFGWLGIDRDGNPYSMKDISKAVQGIEWQTSIPKQVSEFYTTESGYLYGLYSRHGKFFPPYSLIPDYNLIELTYNLI